MRSQYPSWIDADIRATLEQVLLEAPQSAAATPAANSYQQMLADMAQQLRSKQYAIQHKQQQQQQPQGAHPLRASRDDSSIAHQPAPSTNVSASLSQSQGARRPPAGTLPSRSPVRSSREIKRASGSSIARPVSAHHQQPPHSTSPPVSSLSPSAAAAASHSRTSSTSAAASIAPAGTINVPLEWFNDMQSRLASLASLGGPAAEQVSKAAELQRLKYAMLLTKLEEMNRLHREVLAEEHQRQHLRDLEQLQAQHLQEFHARLEAAKAETARLHAEREAERTALAQQRESERVLVDRWSADKDLQLDSLRSHFLQREQLLLESQRASEARAASERESHARAALADLETRDRERREWETARSDYARQVGLLIQEKASLAEQLSRKTAEHAASSQQVLLLTEENVRLRSRASEAQDRLALVDALQASVFRLQAELAAAAEDKAFRTKHAAEQEAELNAREQRLVQMRAEMEAREAARADARRRERRMNADAAGALDGPRGLHRARAEDIDCAWASGPIDRKKLSDATTAAGAGR